MSSKRKDTGKKGGVRTSEMWKGSRENSGGSGALIALIGVIVLVLVFILESRGIIGGKNSAPERGAGVIRINEVMTDNVSALLTENGEASDWIEITNVGTQSVNLHRYSLLLGTKMGKIYMFPEKILAPGEYLVVYADGGTDGTTAPFRLPASGGEELVLMNEGGAIIDSVMLPELRPNSAICRNDAGEWEVTYTATPGAANKVDSEEKVLAEAALNIDIVPDAVEITEVMTANTLYIPDTDGDYCDYIELHNRSNTSVNLSGWYLSDSAAKLKNWSFPAVVLQPDAYITVYCSGKDRATAANDLHTNFKLSAKGETVYLTRPDGKTVSRVTVPVLAANQAYSLVSGVWSTELAPTPGAANVQASAQNIAAGVFPSTGVRINEIMASPTDVDYDWIELYNAGGQAIDLSGYGLSDDASKPRKYQFPAGTTIQSGEYKCLCLSGQNAGTIGGYINVDFALSKDGGYTVSLSAPDGTVIDAVYLPQQFSGISYGRGNNPSEWRFFDNSTLGSVNSSGGYAGKVARCAYSREGGLFRSGESVTVELTAQPGARIYYTTDSSEPTTSSTLYTGPITINSTTILRSRAFADGYLPSYIATHSYLFDAQTKEGVYVVSLVSDMDNLASADKGIMVRGSGDTPNYKQQWEREASFELFTADGKRVLGAECGISLHGQDSRLLPVKTFNVIARSEFGDSRFNYPIFKERDYTSYKSILLRPSGEDYNMSFMRDTMLSSLMKDTSLMYQKWELAVCYLDGEYYTLYYIRERITPDSICQFEGWEGMEDDIDVVRGKSTATHGSNKSFEELLKYVKQNDTSDDSVFAYVEKCVDIDNFIEYMTIEQFSGNTDLLNVRRYRNPKTDGKWRWALYDLDWAFYNDTDSIGKWLDPAGVGANKATDTTFFIACMKNAGFRDRYLTYFGQRMGTDLTTQNIVAKITERYEFLEELLPAYQEKWDINLSRGIKNIIKYAQTRPYKLLKEYFPNALHLSDADMQKYFGRALELVAETAQSADQ